MYSQAFSLELEPSLVFIYAFKTIKSTWQNLTHFSLSIHCCFSTKYLFSVCSWLMNWIPSVEMFYCHNLNVCKISMYIGSIADNVVLGWILCWLNCERWFILWTSECIVCAFICADYVCVLCLYVCVCTVCLYLSLD